MSTDRELLELAAKAAGLDVRMTWTPGVTPWLRESNGVARPWNPIVDDGDALRLATKLGLNIECLGKFSFARASWSCEIDCMEDARQDRYAATRRAIVRAAAELGRKS